jgi:hypothetical protein
LFQAPAHLAGGFVRKSNREDLVRRDVVFVNQVGNAMRQNARLAAARTGEHEHWPVHEFDRFTLSGI